MTARTPEDTLGQGHALSVTACLVAACLGCVGWIHQDHSATGALCLVRKVLDGLVPGCITNSLGKTMVMYHVVDSQVLNGYDPTPVDNFPGLLVSEVGSPVGDPLMHSGERLPSLPATRGALCFLFQEPVNALQVFFVSPEEPWILDLGAIAHCGKAGQSHVDPNSGIYGREGNGLYLTGEGDEPLARACTAHTAGLHLPFNGTMDDSFDIANPRQTHALAHHPESRLWVAEGIVASLPTEAGIARIFLTCSHATEERLEAQVHPHCHVL